MWWWKHLQAGQNQTRFEHELEEAAALYLAAGQLERACRVYANIGAIHSLTEVVRSHRLHRTEQVCSNQVNAKSQDPSRARGSGGKPYEEYEVSAALRRAARAFEKYGYINFAQEAQLSLGDGAERLNILMRAGRWDEALSLAEQVKRASIAGDL